MKSRTNGTSDRTLGTERSAAARRLLLLVALSLGGPTFGCDLTTGTYGPDSGNAGGDKNFASAGAGGTNIIRFRSGSDGELPSTPGAHDPSIPGASSGGTFADSGAGGRASDLPFHP